MKITTTWVNKKKAKEIYDVEGKEKEDTHRFGSLAGSCGNVPSKVVRGSFRSYELEELWWITWP